MVALTGSGKLQVAEVTDQRDLETYRAPWEELLARTPQSGFFDTYEWLNTWLEFFWRERAIAFLFVYRDGSPVALLPLLMDELGEIWCRHTLALPVNSHATRAGLIGEIAAADVLDAICRHLWETRQTVHLGLKSMATGSHLLPVLEEVARVRRLKIHARLAPKCPVVRLNGNWKAYLASRSKHIRSEIRRKRRKIERAGAVQWRIVASAEDSRAAMDDILHIEQRSWKEANGSSLTAVRGLADFYNTLSLRCAERGWLSHYLLYLDHVPVAHMVGMIYRDEYYALKTSFDERYRGLSPGAVLAAYALEQAFAQRLRVFDFLGVPSRWKDELANDVRGHVSWCLFEGAHYRCRMCACYHERMKPVFKSCLPSFLLRGRKNGTDPRATAQPTPDHSEWISRN
jgi:CelD/BcsL family acetyltransferase involved in cellulose biosynthesis